MSYYKPGSWNVICQLCGRQFKSDEIRKRWDGLMVCHNDYETRHPLDFIRATPERASVPYTSPEPTDTFVYVPRFSDAVAAADIGTADYAIVGYIITVFPETQTSPIAGVAVAGGTQPAKGTLL